ncbi:uncharacterized protein TRUGW13939_00990 [Talaromyces rugulosus]|uniref:Uncharacterized protein n=1 Tax=Talaromyces rugulosus TaxID=121627 RepID=A0A7H8QIZ1_TALRU|nr:uncharacterized protein TRUGW13939_00990 [Talaromyces rugulosus]QKX53910.1 hypothetical protein TRUGW13939_00990 [Talaromyces rugulosus]
MPKGKDKEPSHETRDNTSDAEIRSRMSIMGLLNEVGSTEETNRHFGHPNGFLGSIKECEDDQEMGSLLLNRYLQVFENAKTRSVDWYDMNKVTNHSRYGDYNPQSMLSYAKTGKGDFGIVVTGSGNIMSDLSFKLSTTQNEKGNRQDEMKSFLARVSEVIRLGVFKPTTLSFIPRVQCIKDVFRVDIFDRISRVRYKAGSLSGVLNLENVQYHLEVLEILGNFVHEHQLEFHFFPTFCTGRAEEFYLQTSRIGVFIHALWENKETKGLLPARTTYKTQDLSDSFSFYFGDTFAPKP